MSRLLWVGVGAAGGIYLYRRGNRAWDGAKERGVAGNAAVIASSASTMLNHAKRTLAEAQEAKDAEMAEDRVVVLPGRESKASAFRDRTAPSARDPRNGAGWHRGTQLVPDPQNDLSSDPLQGFWDDPQTDPNYEVRAESHGGDVGPDSRGERSRSRRGHRELRAAVSRNSPVRFRSTRNRSSA